MRFVRRGGKGRGRSSSTSPASDTVKGVASNRRMAAPPGDPWHRRSQRGPGCMPPGVTMPMPVTTTLRGMAALPAPQAFHDHGAVDAAESAGEAGEGFDAAFPGGVGHIVEVTVGVPFGEVHRGWG